MKMLCKLVLMSGVAMAAAAFPAVAQQGQQQMPMGGMMGQGGMMGPGMMNQGMMGPGTCSMMGGMGQEMMMGWGMQGMMNPAMMGMMMGGPASQGRLAYVKAELGITDAQTAAWDGYASAVSARVTSMQGMHADMMQAMQTGSAMARMDAHIKAMESMVETLKALKPSTEALYAVLTDEQKQKADQLLGGGCGMM
jgi:LTXXQ motif family protein